VTDSILLVKSQTRANINEQSRKIVRCSATWFASAKFGLEGDKGTVEGLALVDSGAGYTVIDEELAETLDVRYTGLTIVLTSLSGQRISCREAIVNLITVEGKTALSELVAVYSIPESTGELLRKQRANHQLVIGVHTLERIGYAIDVIEHRLIESPGILMITLSATG